MVLIRTSDPDVQRTSFLNYFNNNVTIYYTLPTDKDDGRSRNSSNIDRTDNLTVSYVRAFNNMVITIYLVPDPVRKNVRIF